MRDNPDSGMNKRKIRRRKKEQHNSCGLLSILIPHSFSSCGKIESNDPAKEGRGKKKRENSLTFGSSPGSGQTSRFFVSSILCVCLHWEKRKEAQKSDRSQHHACMKRERSHVNREEDYDFLLLSSASSSLLIRQGERTTAHSARVNCLRGIQTGRESREGKFLQKGLFGERDMGNTDA